MQATNDSNKINNKDWFCEKCSYNNNEDCGPWSEDSKIFNRCKKIHEKHPGWKLFKLKKQPQEPPVDFESAEFFVQGFKQNRFREMKKDLTFKIKEKGKIIEFEPLEEPIKKLRPLSVYDNVAWALIFLPARGTIITEGKNNEHPTYFQSNVPYYINSKKELWHAKDEIINQEFQLPELGLGEKVRWQPIDVFDYIDSENKIDLKPVFEQISRHIGSLIELKNESYLNVFVLWVIGTYFFRLFEYYPYLDFSGSKGSGKTKALVILLCLCYNARMYHKITGPNWARNVDALNCTILVDEQEDLLEPKTENASNLVLLLNSAFRTDADQPISVPQKDVGWASKTFDIGVPVALGHISPLNDITEDRAIPMKMIISKNKKVLDAEVEQNHPIWYRLRDYLHRTYLDYYNEIIQIRHEKIEIENISARERNQIWKPIITLAKLFERQGIEGLVDSVKQVIVDTHQIKIISNQTNNKDIQILEKLCEFLAERKINPISDKDEHQNWYKQKDVLDRIIEEPDLAYISSKELGASLDRLQIERRKKNPFNTCVYIDRAILINLCQRYNLEYQALLAQSSLHTWNSQEQSAQSDQSAQSGKIDAVEYSAQSAPCAESANPENQSREGTNLSKVMKETN